jgi:hypothetical protein
MGGGQAFLPRRLGAKRARQIVAPDGAEYQQIEQPKPSAAFLTAGITVLLAQS